MSPEPPSPPVALLLCALSLSACGDQTVPVDLRVVVGRDQDPYVGAQTLHFVLLEEGEESASWTFPLAETSGRLRALPAGENLVLRVEARAGDLVLARGRSFPFDLRAGRPAPHPDIRIGRLGRFMHTTPAGTQRAGSPVALGATEEGALAVYEDGAFVRYVAHARGDPEVADGEALLLETGSTTDRSGASWAVLRGGLALGVGGTAGGAGLYDRFGRAVALLPPTSLLSSHRDGATVVPLGDGLSALVLGGAPSDTEPATDALTRVSIERNADGETTLVATGLSPLPSPRRDALAQALLVRGRSDCPCERVVLIGGDLGGAWLERATLIDPEGVDPHVDIATAVSRRGAAVTVLFPGLVAIAGGTDDLGSPVDAIGLLSIRVGAVEVLSPAPPPLFFARTEATSVTLGDGLGLVIGGRAPDGSSVRDAELIEFPGIAIPTGALTAPALSPQATVLGDGTVLTLDDEVEAIFVPPR